MAIKRGFGEQARRVPISSTKTITGHLLGAAGEVESVVAVKAIRTGRIAPAINRENPDRDLDYVPNPAREARVRTVLGNSLGFGGQNAAAVFRALD